MMKTYFVHPDSIVRKIWGKADTILFIFAGASAEFALNKSVDWLYFTGRLPSDPLGRLFSTVSYSRTIIFSVYDDALHAIDQITAIHKAVENSRRANIPNEAYLDVLYLLIDYSIRAFELLERKLTRAEKAEVFKVFYRVGERMDLKHLPQTYTDWMAKREEQLQYNLCKSSFTSDLYRQYKTHLGLVRYQLLKQVQVLVVPNLVNVSLGLGRMRWLLPVLVIYKLSRWFRLHNLLKNAILPKTYLDQVKAMDTVRHY